MVVNERRRRRRQRRVIGGCADSVDVNESSKLLFRWVSGPFTPFGWLEYVEYVL